VTDREFIGALIGELRSSLLFLLVTFIALFLLCAFFAPDIVSWLPRPLADLLAPAEQGPRFIYSDITASFFNDIRFGRLAAETLLMPILAWQIWRLARHLAGRGDDRSAR
jgi:sec-independent protein translocase protein TatC